MVLKNILTVAFILGGALVAAQSHWIIGSAIALIGIVIAVTTYKK